MALGLTVPPTLIARAVARQRDTSIRVALGAQPRDVLQLILGQGLQLVLIGLAIGLAAAIAMARVLSRFLPLVDSSPDRIVSRSSMLMSRFLGSGSFASSGK